MMKTEIPLRKPLSFWVKFGYGAAEGANSIVSVPLGLFLLFFLTKVVGIELTTAGAIIAIGVVSDAFTDVMIGMWSDRMRSKWGRRRPFMIVGIFPLAVCTWLVFSDFGFDHPYNLIYFCAVIFAYYTAISIVQIPFASMVAEMTQDYDERTSLDAYRAIWNQIGIIVGASVPLLLVDFFQKVSGNERVGWSAMGIILAIAASLLIVVSWRVTRGYELLPHQNIKVNFRQLTLDIRQNQTFVYTAGLFAAAMIGVNVAATLIIFFLESYMRFNEMQSSVALFIAFGLSICWIPLINYISKRTGKRQTFIIFCCLNIFVHLLVLFLKPNQNLRLYSLLVFGGGGIAAVYMIGWSMIADVVEVDELRSGTRREGIFYSLAVFFTKLSVAVATYGSSLLLAFIDYEADLLFQTEDTLFNLRLIYGFLPAIFYFLAIIVCFYMPMTRAKYFALLEAIKQKNMGEPWDQQIIQGL